MKKGGSAAKRGLVSMPFVALYIAYFHHHYYYFDYYYY